LAIKSVMSVFRRSATAIVVVLACVNINILANPWDILPTPLQVLQEAGIERDPQAIQAVLLDDQRDPELRLESALALAQLEHRESVPVLIQAIDEEIHEVRFGAITALIYMPSTEAVPKLCSVVHSSRDERSRRQAVTALSQTDSRLATQCIVDVAVNENESLRTRRSAVRVLWKIKATVESVDGLVPLLESQDTELRALTALCLHRSYSGSRAIQESLGITDSLVSATQDSELYDDIFYLVIRALEASSGQVFVDEVIQPQRGRQFLEYFAANRYLVAEDVRLWSESRKR